MAIGKAFLGPDSAAIAITALILLAFVVAPWLIAWHFLHRHPHLGVPDPEPRSFRLSVGAWHRHIVFLGIVAFAIVGVMLTHNPLTQSVYDYIGADNLENEVVRSEVAGESFDIPMRYFVMDGYVKRGYWPRARNHRVDAGALSFSVLLPELRPFYAEEEHLWNLDGGGRGDRLDVMITENRAPNWYEAIRQRLNEEDDRRMSNEEAEAYGVDAIGHELKAFSSAMGVRYIPRTKSPQLSISCVDPREVPYPSCRVKSNFRDAVVLEYRYSNDYLSDWRRIDQEVKTLIDRLSVAEEW